MFFNDLYRKVRFRADDPMRYLHVPRRHRVDVDEPEHIGELDEVAVDLTERTGGTVVTEQELA